ncbi:MAG: YfhO family protein [Cyclobacteriaceae bacterium]|nr:MAG: YfhO family protein [Cyclobacteriaceae bacterium]
MNFATVKQKALPHLLATLIFILLTVIFYSPIFFEGKILNQNDVNQGIASGSELAAFREKTGEEGLWTNSMFSGMPAYLISLRWSGSEPLTIIEKVISLGFPNSAKETFLSLVCFYILLIVFGIRPSIAIAGAIAYAFSTYFIVSIEAGHLWKMRAIAYAPLVLAGVHLAYTKRLLWGFAVTALALALEINSNHIQITYYLGLMLVIYGIVQLIFAVREKEIKSFFISSTLLVGAVVLAIGANLGKLWSTYEYGKYSIRGKSELTSNTQSTGGLDRDYAFEWSSGVAESFTFLVPNFYGGASGNYTGQNSDLEIALRQNNVPEAQIAQYTRGLLGYWGPQPFTSGPVYAGALVVFFFVLGILYADKRNTTWLIAATVLSIVLSWGKHFPSVNYFLFDYLPMYNKFRAVSMAVVIALMAMPLLGCLGLEKLLQEKWDKKSQKNLFIALGVTGGLALLIAIIAYIPALDLGDVPQWVKNAVDSSRKSIIRKDAFRTIFFVVAAGAVVFFYLRKSIGTVVFSGLLILLMVIDIMGVDYRYVQEENYIKKRRNNFFTETPADQVIKQDKSTPFRVLNFQNPFNEARTSAFHHSIGGYHGAKMRRYQDLITHHLQHEMNDIMQAGNITASNANVLNMLNTRYLLAGQTADAVIRNPHHNGNAWFVQEVLVANNPDEEIQLLDSINTKTQAVIDVSKFSKPEFTYDSSASIRLTEYAPNKLVYEATTATDGYAVFSEIYYPEGWKAFIDGQETSIDRVNYVLRAIKIPAGSHAIEFRFQPKSYSIGNKFMLVANILMLVVIATAMWNTFRKVIKG